MSVHGNGHKRPNRRSSPSPTPAIAPPSISSQTRDSRPAERAGVRSLVVLYACAQRSRNRFAPAESDANVRNMSGATPLRITAIVSSEHAATAGVIQDANACRRSRGPVRSKASRTRPFTRLASSASLVVSTTIDPPFAFDQRRIAASLHLNRCRSPPNVCHEGNDDGCLRRPRWMGL